MEEINKNKTMEENNRRTEIVINKTLGEINKKLEEKEEFNKLEEIMDLIKREKEVFNSVGNRGFFKGNEEKFKVREYNKEYYKTYYLENKDKLKANRKPLTDEQKERNKVLRQNRNKGLRLYKKNFNTKKERLLKEKIRKLNIRLEKLKNA